MALTEWRLLRHPAALTVIGLMFALMARESTTKQPWCYWQDKHQGLRPMKKRQSTYNIESHATMLDIKSPGSSIGAETPRLLHKKRLSLWPTARVLKRSGKEDPQAIEKYECLSMYKPVRAASVSNGSPVHQNNAVARSIRASNSLQCQNAIAAPSRSATLCKYKRPPEMQNRVKTF